MRHRKGLRLRKLLVLLAVSTAISSAHADDALDDRACRELGPPGSPNYLECRLLLLQARSGDPYQSAFARAGLLRLQQRLFEDMRRPPWLRSTPPGAVDFGSFGRDPEPGQKPLRLGPPASPPAGGLECQTWGDGMGGGITRCY